MEDFRQIVTDIIYSKEFFSAAYGMTKNVNDAKDLIQDAALKALNSEGMYNVGNIHGWLFVILKNAFINKIRLHQHKKMIYIGNDDLFMDQWMEPESVSRESDKSNACDIERLLKCIKKLPVNHGDPILLSLGGYKIREIAEIVGVPQGTIKCRIHKGKKVLKQNKELAHAYKNKYV
jgi:RNA polymerase sigma factor (sigma-70 family)